MTAEFHKQTTLVETVESPHVGAFPTEIGGYKIESLLSKGGMSVLYLALHPQTLEPIVIKVLSKDYLSHSEMVERFLKEAEIIAMTNHPNIVKVFSRGRWEGGVYIAMEFIQGISLRQMILQQAMPLRRALEIVLQIAHAITHLHVHGIIHRDLKPENILLTAQGGIKVIDFGIAALYEEKEKGSARRKTIMGTPAYMSPEQRDDPAKVGFSSDIYSLAVITYELVLGRLSHGSIHISLMPKGLQKIMTKALAAKVEERYEDIVDFIKDLSTYLASEEIKKEMRGSDYLGELSEGLKGAHALLIPSKLPDWPRMEMALVSNISSSISSVYYDFFTRKSNIHHVLLAESVTTGVEGLIAIAKLRGMIRSLATLIENPGELIYALNNLIVDEEDEQTYTLAFLTLFPLEERLSYISCGYSPLWHIPAGALSPRREGTANLALGVTSSLEPIHLDTNWKVGDALILHTFQTSSSDPDHTAQETLLADAIKENIHLSSKQRLEAIFRKVVAVDRSAFEERAVTLISLKRTE